MRTLDPATCLYSFWEGIPPAARRQIGMLFAASRTLVTVVVVQRSDPEPEAMMAELGFGRLSLVDNFPVEQSGAR